METEDEVRRLTVDEITLLREIARWRRNHGVSYFQWRPGVGFGVFTEWYRYGDRKRRTVSYEPDGARVLVDHDYYGSGRFEELPVRTVTEAVDCLVALGFLPARFASAYRAGWRASFEHGYLITHGRTSASMDWAPEYPVGECR